MRLHNLGGYSNIDAYVRAKIKKLHAAEASEKGAGFRSLYPLMFSERDNIFWEKTVAGPSGAARLIQKTTYGQVYDSIEETYPKVALTFKNNAGSDGCFGRLIGLSMANSVDWIVAFWSILHAGYNPLLINTRLPKALLKKTLERAVQEEGLIGIISDKTDYASEEDGCGFTDVKTYFWRDIKAKTVAQGDYLKTNTFGTLVYLMSSGTSLNVKISSFGAEQIYAQVSDSAKIIAESSYMKKHYHGEIKQLAFLPFYHVFGLMAVYFWFAFFSRTFVELTSLDANTLLNTIRQHKVTHIFCVPLFWESVYRGAQKSVEKLDAKTRENLYYGLKTSSIIYQVPVLGNFLGNLFSHFAFKPVRDKLFGESPSFLISGGGPISKEIMEFFNSIGYHFANGYGMTEVGIACVELSNAYRLRVNGSAGKAFHSIDFSMSDEGTLLIRGKGISRGAQSEAWFDSKDICELKKGRVVFNGRSDDLLIGPDGENINPYLYEQELTEVEGIERVLLLPDTRGKAKGKLVVLVEGTLTEERLMEEFQKLNLISLVSRSIITTEPLIEGDEFKVNRRKLAQEVAEGHFDQGLAYHPSSEDATAEQSSSSVPTARSVAYLDQFTLMDEIRSCFADAIGKKEKEINPDGDFFMQEGGTSLAFFTFDALFSARFGVSAYDLCPAGNLTVRALAEALMKRALEEENQ